MTKVQTSFSQDASLNEGFGRVRPELRFTVTIPTAVVMMGAAQNFISGIFAAVHQHNRHAPVDDFVGLLLPEISSSERGLQALGGSVEIIGSGAAIERLIELRILPVQVAQAYREGGAAVEPYQVAPDADLISLVRDRKHENATLPRMRSEMRRIERRIAAAKNEEHKSVLERARGVLEQRIAAAEAGKKAMRPASQGFMRVVHVKLGFRTEVVAAADVPSQPMVNTYGLSSLDAPLVTRDRSKADAQPAYAGSVAMPVDSDMFAECY